MKRIFLPALFIIMLPLSYSCGSTRLGSYVLNERDAASAIRQLLQLGVTQNNFTSAFSKETILSTVFPAPVSNILNTINSLGLTKEVDRFTTTLSTAAEKTATASAPIFINSINNMKFTDAIRIIKSGGTSATDYLRSSAGDSVRKAIRPIMLSAMSEYKLTEQWNNIVKPVRGIAGNKLNLDLENIMSGIVAEAMFKKIAEKETQVRTDAAARTTNLLQKVFSKSWN